MTKVKTEGTPERAEIVKPERVDPRVHDYEIIDTDIHLLPDWDRLRDYMPEPYRTKLKTFPLVGSDYNPSYATNKPGTGQEVFGRAKTGADVLDSMKDTGANSVIIVPGFLRPQSMYHKSWVSILASAYNDYVIENVFPASPDIKAELMINQRIPEDAAREIRRVGHHKQFVSAYTEFGGNYEQIGTVDHDPIFEAALEHQLIVTLHAGTFWQAYTPLHQGARTWTELLGVSTMAICLADIASMIIQGVFDKYPDLRCTVKEGGFWWIPEMTLRLDDYYLNHPHDISLCERKIEAGEAFLRHLPSDYIWEHFRFSTQPMLFPKNPKHAQWLWEMCRAEDMLLFSTDWPHATFDPPNWMFDTGFITEKARRRIFSENARAWYPRLAK
jgi:predicted TIM-barrel fold metal-dependent hydrolase